MRKYIIAGLLFWIPVWITFIVIRFIVDLLDRSLALLPNKYQPEHVIGFNIPGLGLIFTIIIVFITGVLVTNYVGHRFVHAWERILARIPLIRSIYQATKQVISAVIQPKEEAFRKVVLVDFPRFGMSAVGFQTSETLTNVPNFEKAVTIFIPTSPNPTSGFLMVVSKEDVTEINMSVEEAFKFIISIGSVFPEKKLHKNKPSSSQTQT